MATLKLKHLILYFITFLLLYFSDLPGGALLSLAAWLQMCILLWRLDYNIKNQVNMLVYFLTLVPLFFFLGSTSDFTKIYLREGSMLFFFFISFMTLIICFLTVLFGIFCFKQNISNFNVSQIYTSAIKSIQHQKKELALTSICLFVLILIPIPMKQDFKISLSIILIHLYLKRKQIRDSFSSP
jgi:hypothetical protein